MKKYRILIVDDIYTNRLLLSELIKTLDYESLEAENGKEAIEVLENNEVDLVLMDIEMPVMNGTQTCRYIRQNMKAPNNDVPIVALTAHNPNMFFEDFNETGFNELLTKPYSLDKIIDLIKNLT
ncbi:MAG: response regulator [Bacteroidales bacterium]